VPVAAVEERLVGGECPFWGCVPSKMMIRAGNLLAEGRHIPGMAGASVISPDWAPVARRIRDEATYGWTDTGAADRFTGLGGTLYRGHGILTGLATVRVGDTVLRARRGIVVGTGTAPWIPPLDGLVGTPYWTSRQAMEADQVPRSLIVLGGGQAGVELAQVFARFGTGVTIIEAADRLPEPVEIAAYYAVAEALTNTAKHAQASTAEVEVCRSCCPSIETDALGRGATGQGEGRGVRLARGVHPADRDRVARVVLDQRLGDLFGRGDALPADRGDRVFLGQAGVGGRGSGQGADDAHAAGAALAAEPAEAATRTAARDGDLQAEKGGGADVNVRRRGTALDLLADRQRLVDRDRVGLLGALA
jgi:hypothetical protein